MPFRGYTDVTFLLTKSYTMFNDTLTISKIKTQIQFASSMKLTAPTMHTDNRTQTNTQPTALLSIPHLPPFKYKFQDHSVSTSYKLIHTQEELTAEQNQKKIFRSTVYFSQPHNQLTILLYAVCSVIMQCVLSGQRASATTISTL